MCGSSAAAVLACSLLWEECILPESKTPRLAETQGMFASALSTWKKRFRTEYRNKWEEKSKVKERHTERNKARNREATRNNQPLIMDGMRMR